MPGKCPALLNFILISALLLGVSPWARAGMFVEAPHYPLTGEPGEVALADFNLDGKVDMVLATFLTSQITLSLGNGDGTFQPGVVIYTGDAPPFGVGDFNGDGKPDLVIGGPATITFYMGKGDGTFQVGGTSLVASGYGLSSADMNGDGKLDLVTVSSDVNQLGVYVVLGNGDGTFQSGNFFATQHLNLAVKLADINHDGKVDVVTGEQGGAAFVGVLLGNGDGTLQAHQEFPAGTSAYLTSLALADFNHDGNLDVAANISGSDSLVLLLGNGNGTLRTFVTIATGDNPQAVVTGDFNADGNPDLASANFNDNSVNLHLGNGDGTFQPPLGFRTGQSPTGLGIADLNNDGRVDLLTTDIAFGNRGWTFTVLLGLGNGALRAAAVYDVGVQDSDRMASGDFDGDGNLDLLINASTGNAFSLLLNNGNGTFGQPKTTNVGKTPTDVAAGDFNNDGKLDVVTANNAFANGSVSILLGNGDGTLQPHVDVSLPRHPLWVATGDFNRDGNLDVAVVEFAVANGNYISDVSVLLGNGDGTLQSPVAYAFPGYSYAMAVADVDGDGRPDLLVSSFNVLTVLPGRGDGTFRSPITTTCSGRIFSFAMGDLNEDGKLDAVVSIDNSVAILIGNGNGTFQSPANRYSPGGGQVTLVDLNLDGHLDVLTPIKTRLGNGDGTLRTAQSIASSSVVAADFNGDGYPDVAGPTSFGGTAHTIVVEMSKGAGRHQ